jgi:hypothetical protein
VIGLELDSLVIRVIINAGVRELCPKCFKGLLVNSLFYGCWGMGLSLSLIERQRREIEH